MECSGEDFGGIFFTGDRSDDEVDIVGFVTGEGLEIFGVDEFSIDIHFVESGARGGFCVFFVKAFPCFQDRGKDAEFFVFFEEDAQLFADGFRGLGDNGCSGLGTVLDADFGVEEAEKVIDFGDGADGGFAPAS